MRSVHDLLGEARSGLDRYSAVRTWQALADGALVVDIRSHAQRLAGEIPGALVLERNVLECPGTGRHGGDIAKLERRCGEQSYELHPDVWLRQRS